MATSLNPRGAAVRRRIEAAAVELITERGWGSVSTRMLAERAGVTPGLVHYHYRSLDDALRCGVIGAARTMIDEFGRMIDRTDDPDRAMAMVWAMLDRHPAQGPESTLILEATLASLRDPELRSGLAEVVHVFRASVADRLRRAGVAAPDETAAVLAATIDGVMLHRILTDDLAAGTVQPIAARMLQPAPSGDQMEARS
jgi:AcrR family transcriptional regulator